MTSSLHLGIVAHPAAHSLSPVLYRAGCEAAGLRMADDIPMTHDSARFDVFDVLPEDFSAFFQRMRAGEIDGVAVSVPYKETIIPLLDWIDPCAAEIGAVNTVRVRNGRLEGYNTDWLGVQYALREALVGSGKKITSWKWKNVLIVGAGGAARAVAYALREEGAHIFILNRTRQRAEEVAKAFGGSVVTLGGDDASNDAPRGAEDMPSAFDLVVNATSVGLETDESPLPISFWEERGNGVAFDCVYRDRGVLTRFLREADRAGWATVSGETMLIGQAVEQFFLLTGRHVDATVFARALSR